MYTLDDNLLRIKIINTFVNYEEFREFFALVDISNNIYRLSLCNDFNNKKYPLNGEYFLQHQYYNYIALTPHTKLLDNYKYDFELINKYHECKDQFDRCKNIFYKMSKRFEGFSDIFQLNDKDFYMFVSNIEPSYEADIDNNMMTIHQIRELMKHDFNKLENLVI